MRARTLHWWLLVGLAPFLLVGGTLNMLVNMPGSSFSGSPGELSEREREWRDSLRAHVHKLGGEIGERNIWKPNQFRQARTYIESQFEKMGYQVNRVSYDLRGRTHHNLEVGVKGTTHPKQVLVVGAHYDTVQGSPGANDNATGVSLVLELAREFQDRTPDRTLRFVTFANEEPPFFKTSDMGSYRYAQHLQNESVTIRAMWSLETLGYYSDEPGSQSYPPVFGWFYPDRGNFVGFVGNITHRSLVYSTIGQFRKYAKIPSEGGALPSFVPGVNWSDHWSFWQFGIPAIMVTDTAPFRYPHYHRSGDTPEKVDFEALSRFMTGFLPVLASKASPKDG